MATASQAMRLHAQLPGAFTVSAVNYCDGTTRMLSVDTSQFVSDLAYEHGLAGQAAVDNPVTSNPGYEFWGAKDAKERDNYLENKRFRALTGSINYCACTGRPDVAHAASDTSPSLKHMNARVRQVREMLRLGILSYGHVKKGSENPADALTKRLTAAVFNVHALSGEELVK